ncbi:MAG: carbohydrate kinase [Lachnospiraceae bacterium]|nr:carbohydrate kinase [Lachnospiraceae bacterium]
MYHVVALGELVIDFSPGGVSDRGNALYERQPGGAPSNVLAAVSRLGGNAALMGMVGDDSFGYYLQEMALSCGIDCAGLCFTKEAYTTLAFVHLDGSGERSFTVMRKPGADTQLRREQVRTDMISDTRILHVSAAALTDDPCREAVFYAAMCAKKENKLISFDANYREALWGREEAVKVMRSFLPYVDILKVSEEEMTMLTDVNDIPQGAKKLSEQGISLVTVTCGSEGSYYSYAGGVGFVPTYTVQTIDTNGAGDAFLGTLLYQISCLQDGGIKDIPQKNMERMLRAASAAGALCAARPGALLNGPTREEINELAKDIIL